MDVGAGLDGIAKDIDILREEEGRFGTALLLLLAGLPLLSFVQLARGRRVALLTLAFCAFVLAAWFVYYATDWIGTQSGALGGVLALLFLLGWILLAVDGVRAARGR